MTQEKKQANASCGTAVPWDQGIRGKLRRITTGRSRWQQGLIATYTDSSNEPTSAAGESQTDRRMSP